MTSKGLEMKEEVEYSLENTPSCTKTHSTIFNYHTKSTRTFNTMHLIARRGII